MSLTRRIGLALLSAAVAATLAVLHHHFVPEAAERIDLHGTWRIVSHELNGKQDPVAPERTVAIDGVAMTLSFTNAGEMDSEAPFRLDARALPRRMDIRFRMQQGSVPANAWDGLTRAVYERIGSTLKLAWYTNDITNPNPNGRPTQFPMAPAAYTARLELAR
jgi:uncharacterized protein (TIGR03067 family)